MNEFANNDWAARYRNVAGELSAERVASRLRPGLFLCGMSAVVDARVDMHDMAALEAAMAGSRAAELFEYLKDKAARGVGGEDLFDWPEGPEWIRENVRVRHALGGTGPQAAWVLSKLGARSVIALKDRYRLMLEQIPSGVLLSKGEELLEASAIAPDPQVVPEIFIFEYTAGRPIADVTPPRSSRIILRFADHALQDDADFKAITPKLAAGAAAGLLSGLSGTALDDLPEAARELFGLARAWRTAGLKVVHFELAGYSSPEAMKLVLDALVGSVTSLGMSQSELRVLHPDTEQPMDAMIELAERLKLDRVCVHADEWAATVTRSNPEVELRALMAGCAIASARAASGAPVAQVTISANARFAPLPFDTFASRGGWSFVACSVPYLEKPQTTLGLGDSFTAGCLLILGSEQAGTT